MYKRNGFRFVPNLKQTTCTLTVAFSIGLFTASVHGQVSGNIHPKAIEIDIPSANLFPTAPGSDDWVKDSLANTDTPSLVNSIATGVKTSSPNQTGAAAIGHWNGVRIVDGLNQGDQDIFLTGGKENDLSTWNVGPGSVGSSKYDISQAYLANNATKLFFGMERSGNNGTTAFDFEFNVAPPASTYLPTRTVDDVLFTFEMQGSGGSGSATPHFFKWDGSQYVEQTPPPASLVSSINQADVPAAPWGYVNSQGNWALGNIPRFEFAEASVLLSEAFPNFDPCNSSAFVQVRTRSSSTANSDLKDTTKIFEFKFGGPTAAASYTPSCLAQFSYSSTGSKDSTGGTSALTYNWSFTPPSGVTLSGTGITGPDANGAYHSALASGTVTVNLPAAVQSAVISAFLKVIESTACNDSTTAVNLTVFRPLAVTAAKTVANANNLSVTLAATSNGATSHQWQRLSGANWVDIAGQLNSSVVYSTFDADATPSASNFTLSGDSFVGKLFTVQLRVHVSRTQNGLLCEAFSDPVTVKKLIAVDP